LTSFLFMGRAIAASIVAGASFVISSSVQAGAFNPAAGEGVAILTTRFTDGRDFIDGAGRRWRAPRWRKFETQLHVEYGVTDWLAAIARPRVVSIHEDGRKGFRGGGIGASEIGLQARLWRTGDWAFAARVMARLPASPGGRFATWEDRGGVELSFALGRSFTLFGMAGFVDMEVGARTRGGRADEAIASQTVGIRPTEKLLVMIQSFSTQSVESPRRRALRGAPMGEWRITSQIGLVYEFAPKWSLGVAAHRTFLVRDGAQESGGSVSLQRRF
jgi:hypothetical protein